jgi:hypothetical protein
MSIDPVTTYLYEPGSTLEVPGVEAVLEYGDASTYAHGGIPGALRINDRSKPDQVHVTELTGLQDDPDVGDSRTERATRWGERTGLLVPRGRTVGITGQVRSNSVHRMRDLWRMLRSQFGRVERDLIVHPPIEAPFYVNEVWSTVVGNWTGVASATNGTIGSPATFSDGTLNGVTLSATTTSSSPIIQSILRWATLSWLGEDVWLHALVAASAAPATPGAVDLRLIVTYADASTADIVVASQSVPTIGTYYPLSGRISAGDDRLAGAVSVRPAITLTTTATTGTYTLRAARVSHIFLGQDESTPVGFVGGALPGFEYEGAAGQSRAYGPCYAVNQVRDPDVTAASSWANDSTSGVTVDVAGSIARSWPNGGSATAWNIHNPSTTSRTLAVRVPATLSDPNLFIVARGRSYRGHVRMLVKESYAAGALQIVWLDKAGSTISTSTLDVFDAVSSSATAQDVDLDGVAVTPPLAQRAYMRIVTTTPSTVTNDRLHVLIAEPRFFDVSEYDLGDSAPIDGTQETAHGLAIGSLSRSGASIISTPTGARRRIPRPFLLRKVRSIWDGKAPESQRNLQARRDFTMSLRASDPRIYAFDERHASLKIATTPSLISAPLNSFAAQLGPWDVVGSDAFVGAVDGSVLGGRTATLGGNWATSGATTDFVLHVPTGGVPITENNAQRTTIAVETAGRFAILGTSVYTDVQVDMLAFTSSSDTEGGPPARWVDANNYLRLSVPDTLPGSGSLTETFYLEQVVAGSITGLTAGTFTRTYPLTYRFRLAVFASGRAIIQVLSNAGSVIGQSEGFSSALATGGALATGKVGFYDRATSASGGATRAYTEFVATAPAVSPEAAPAGFTYEGASLTPEVHWHAGNSFGEPIPRDGVALGWDTAYPPFWLTGDSLARMYYSAGSLTYTTPQVTVAGDVIDSAGFDYDLFADSLVVDLWQYNYIGALIKRVSSSSWIEARYNSANQAVMNGYHASPTAPNSLELWCSHTASGSSGTTKLAGWDVPIGNIIDGRLKHVRAYMDAADTVYVELWDEDPNLGDHGLIARRSFTMSGGLAAVLGHTVAGRTGMMVRLARWNEIDFLDFGLQKGFNVETLSNNYDTPYLASFEAIDFATSLLLINCPVIGDVDDVPLKLTLRGGLDTPTITLVNVDTGASSTLRLSGVFAEADPITIDMDAGTIRSASGIDYFSRRQIGSRFFALQPGNNVLAVQAVGWDTSAPAHIIVTWNDAVK